MALPLSSGCAWTTHQWSIFRFERQLNAADAALADSQYELAATRYEALLDRYPDSPQRDQMRYRQGVAYTLLGSYPHARDAFRLYLLEFPEGQYRRDAREHQAKIRALLDTKGGVTADVLAAAREDLDRLTQLAPAHPGDPQTLVALGDRQYELGHYDEAAQSYFEATRIDAALMERSLIQDRLMIDAQGNPAPVTPAMQTAAQRESQPVVVFKTNEFRGRNFGSGDGGGDLAYHAVTGMVRNQSARLLGDVMVEVNFLDVNNRLLDTQTYRIGPMAPGEVRPFRVKSGTFDNLLNIDEVIVNPIWRG